MAESKFFRAGIVIDWVYIGSCDQFEKPAPDAHSVPSLEKFLESGSCTPKMGKIDRRQAASNNVGAVKQKNH